MSNAVPFPSNTRVMSFSGLSEDVLHQVLSQLPDPKTFAATIRASKQLWNIRCAHPKSIARSVAENTCGHPEVLPAALRLVRKVIKGDDADDETEPEDEVENGIVIPQEPPETEILDIPITREEADLLDNYGQVVRLLQDVYSWRHKDRTSATSQLTPAEALHFKRGMYRFWLYCECYSPPEYYAEVNSDAREAARERAADEFLRLLPAEHLFEMAAAAAFCAEMYEWNHTAWNSTDLSHLPASLARGRSCLGPRLIWEDFENLGCDQPENADNSGFFWTSFERAVTHLQLGQQTRDDRLAHAIVKEVVGTNDSCDRCHAVRGTDLWGSTDWPLLRGFISLIDFTTFLPGRLPKNTTETRPLLNRLGSEFWVTGVPRAKADELITSVMEEIIDMEVDGGGIWTRDGWYCLECVHELLKERLWRWWYAKKRDDGTPEMPSCWYGYNCRTMIHRQAHAAKLNHLCVPTRGDP